MSARLKTPSSKHRSRCQICLHAQQEQIEQDFLNWTSAPTIARDYGLGSHRAVFRHAAARGLVERRRTRWRSNVHRLIEHPRGLEPTAGALVAALRLQFRMESRERMGRNPAVETDKFSATD